MINLFKIFLKYVHISYFHHFRNWNLQFWNLWSLLPWYLRQHNSKLNKKMCAPIIPSWSITSTVLKEMNNLPFLFRILIGNRVAACYNCSWFYPAANSSSGGWIRVTAISSLGGWIQATNGSSFGGWIQVMTDSILRLTQVPVTGCELQLTPFHGQLELRRRDTSYSWYHSMLT